MIVKEIQKTCSSFPWSLHMIPQQSSFSTSKNTSLNIYVRATKGNRCTHRRALSARDSSCTWPSPKTSLCASSNHSENCGAGNSLGIQSPCQMMFGVYNHLLRKVFRFHYHSQKVIGSIGLVSSFQTWKSSSSFFGSSNVGGW